VLRSGVGRCRRRRRHQDPVVEVLDITGAFSCYVSPGDSEVVEFLLSLVVLHTMVLCELKQALEGFKYQNSPGKTFKRMQASDHRCTSALCVNDPP
jgi:hypothetical protein